jgi:peptidoglycan/LPS O-acetylase OafA/YrhL
VELICLFLLLSMSKKRLDIQGLRAFAIIGVLGFHVWPRWMPGGFLGVDV